MEFGPADVARMKEIERALERELMKFNQRGTEAAIPIGALLLLARRLIRLYPEPRRSAIITGAQWFLENTNPDAEIIPFETIARTIGH